MYGFPYAIRPPTEPWNPSNIRLRSLLPLSGLLIKQPQESGFHWSNSPSFAHESVLVFQLWPGAY